MLSVDEALKLVLDHATPLASHKVQADSALGLLLAEAIISDIDSPPHDKSIVDGYAVVAADVAAPGVGLTVLEEVTAGMVPTRAVERGAVTRIMTGAPLPQGADAVVMVEQTTNLGDDRVRIDAPTVRLGQNIMRRATSLARGQVVLQPGKVLRAIEIGLLAEVGCETVQAIPRPRVAVIATGNELVSTGAVLRPGQIRNSNGPLLQGLVGQASGACVPLGIARDEPEALRREITFGLERDILVLSGGVSAGVLDLVPQVLAELGVEQVFHKVNLKPGKPLWFGVKRHQEQGRQTLVFGLPGNPVSGLVCFELFVRPAIQKLSGREPVGLPRVSAKLTQDHQQRGDRSTYWPARLSDGLLGLRCVPSELQTCLTSIIGFSEVLQQRTAIGTNEKRYIENILNSAHDLKEAFDGIFASKESWSIFVEMAGSGRTNYCDPVITPLPWKGSGDLRTLTDANCLACFPAGERLYRAGDEIAALLLDER